MNTSDFLGLVRLRAISATAWRNRCRAAAVGMMLLVSGCGPIAVAGKALPASEPVIAENPENEIAARADAGFYPDGRVFVCRYGTGLDPTTKVEHLPRHVQTLPEIHERYVQEFTLRPGFGMERYHWRPSQWVELIVENSSADPAAPSAEKSYPARETLNDLDTKRMRWLQRPKYDDESETLTLPGATVNEVVERIWNLREMHLVGLVKHKEPVVYLGEAASTHAAKEAKPGKDARPNLEGQAAMPTRELDAFEDAALTQLRQGMEVVARTTAGEMRLLGAIRARTKCLACHDVGRGALLGAFTYTHAVKSEATEQARRLADTAELTPDELKGVKAIESIGGTLKRDMTEPGRPVTSISLRDTKTKDVGLQSLALFAGLKALDVAYTKVTDEGLQDVVQHERIQELDLSGTKITNAGLKQLAKLQQLRELRLWSTGITDAGLPELRVFPLLDTLHLAQMPISHAGLKEIAGLKKLRSLSLFNTKITDAGLSSVKRLDQLQELDLARTLITDAGLKDLRELRQLRTLDLSLTEVTDAGMVHLKSLTQLRTLRLNRVKRLGPGLKALQSLTQLQTLELRVNDVTDEMLQNLTQLKQLQTLDLGNSRITDAGLNELKELKQLQKLGLADTKVTDKGVADLTEALPGCAISR